MTSLLDIGPLTEDVSVGGKPVTVYGISPEGFFTLLSTFPELRELANVRNLSGVDLVRVVPSCISKAIAISTTPRWRFSDAEKWAEEVMQVESVAARLSLHNQLALLNAAIRLTFPEGVGPFVDQINLLTGAVSEASGRASGTTSRKPRRSGFSSDSRGMRLGPASQSVN